MIQYSTHYIPSNITLLKKYLVMAEMSSLYFSNGLLSEYFLYVSVYLAEEVNV